MDFKLVSIFLFALKIEDIHLSFYYSGTVTDSHYNAVVTCERFGGTLLQYGMDFVNASLQCQQNVYIWAGIPFYDQLWGCFKGGASKKTPPDMRQEDKRVAICADFCGSDEYTHFGLMTTECHCYNQTDFSSLEKSYFCQIPSCPGNELDICGVSPWAIVFEKVYQVQIMSCQARDIRNARESHEFTGYCYDSQPFWCRVGDSNEVSCSLPEVQPTTLLASTTDSTLYLSTSTEATGLSSFIPTTQAVHSFYSSMTNTELSNFITATTETSISSPTLVITEQISTRTSDFSLMPTKTLTVDSTPVISTSMSTSQYKGSKDTSTQGSKVTTDTSTQGSKVTTETSTQGSKVTTETSTQGSKVTTETSTQGSKVTTETSTQGSKVTTEASTTVVSTEASTTEDTADKRSQISKEDNTQAIIIGVVTVLAIVIIIIIVITVIIVRKRKKTTKPKSPKHEYPIPDVFFTNSTNGEPSIDHNSIRFRNSGDIVRSIPFKTREPMYDEEFLVYDKDKYLE